MLSQKVKISYFKGTADDWYANYVSEASAEKKPSDWQGLKGLMIQCFLPCDHSNYIRDRTRNCVQGYQQNVSSYLMTMQRLCKISKPDMKDDEIIGQVLEGVHPDIRRQVIVN